MSAIARQDRVPRRPEQILLIAVCVVGLVFVGLVMAGRIAGHLARQDWQEQVAAYESQVESAEAESASSRVNIERDYTEAVETLMAEIARGEELYAGSNDQVLQDDLRMQLLLATNAGEALLASGPTYLTEAVTVPAISADSTRVEDSRPSQTFPITTGTTPAVADIQAATSRIAETMGTVEQSQQQWATSATEQ